MKWSSLQKVNKTIQKSFTGTAPWAKSFASSKLDHFILVHRFVTITLKWSSLKMIE
jgi:hypothetical protein